MSAPLSDRLTTIVRYISLSHLFALLLWLQFTLYGCTPATGPHLPVMLPEAFSQAGMQPTADQWWREFGDPELDALVEQALNDNFTLHTFWSRLDQALAVAGRIDADRLPTLTAEGEAAAVRRDGNDGRSDSQSYRLGLFAGYEIDLWGRRQANREAAAADIAASRYDLHAAAMLLSSRVAGSWLQLIELRGQLALLEAQNDLNHKALRLIAQRFRVGQTGIADLLQQRQLIESNRGEAAQVAARLKVTEHQLAILLGDPPGRPPVIARSRLVELPPLPETGLPLQLVQRRPDILSAWFRLRAADQRLAVAVADRLPTLGLAGRVETSAGHVRELFDNWLASLAANLVGPVIDGGRRRAEVDRTTAVASQAWSDYGQAVLAALGEVEDALVREEQQRLFLASLDQQIELAEQALQRIRDRYLQGVVDYQRVLSAQTSLQSLQRRQLTAQREILEIRIDLYRALGGGWQLRRPMVGLAVESQGR